MIMFPPQDEVGDYGIDWEGPTPSDESFEIDMVEVPDIYSCELSC